MEEDEGDESDGEPKIVVAHRALDSGQSNHGRPNLVD